MYKKYTFAGLQGIPILAGEPLALPLEEKILPQVNITVNSVLQFYAFYNILNYSILVFERFELFNSFGGKMALRCT